MDNRGSIRLSHKEHTALRRNNAWANWHINRGRMSLNFNAKEMRQVSNRRVF